MNLILPWWSKYAAIAALIAFCCLYTGLKVAGHYQDKIAKINAVGVIQKERTKYIEVKQKEVLKHVAKQTEDATRLSDAFYDSLLHHRTGTVSYDPKVAEGTGSSTEGDQGNSARCTQELDDAKRDWAADAIQVIQLLKAYHSIQDLHTHSEIPASP